MNETERLKQRLEDQQVLLAQDKERKKKKPNVLMEEETEPTTRSMDFWCSVCQEDFTSPAYKTKHRLYGDPVAVWRAKCPECEEECIRLITHKDEDPYYYQSAKIRRQRNEYATELLQADDYGFKSYYGQPNKEVIENMKRNEEDYYLNQRQKGFRKTMERTNK